MYLNIDRHKKNFWRIIFSNALQYLLSSNGTKIFASVSMQLAITNTLLVNWLCSKIISVIQYANKVRITNCMKEQQTMSDPNLYNSIHCTYPGLKSDVLLHLAKHLVMKSIPIRNLGCCYGINKKSLMVRWMKKRATSPSATAATVHNHYPLTLTNDAHESYTLLLYLCREHSSRPYILQKYKHTDSSQKKSKQEKQQ